MCLVQVLTIRIDKMLTEEGSERSTKGDSETAPLLAMSRIPCRDRKGERMGDSSGKSQRCVKGEQGKVFSDTGMWGQNVATVGRGAAIAHKFQSHWQGLWKKSLPRAIKSTTTSDSKSVNEPILRGRENEKSIVCCV